MRSTPFLLSLLMLSSVVAAGAGDERAFPILKGPYMGQTPPGLRAEVFAPGIVSTEAWEVEGVFAPGMQEFYFTIRGGGREVPTVIGYRQEGNTWRKYLEFVRDGEVTFSPDGTRMYMAEGYRDREGDGWSERRLLPAPFQTPAWGVMRLSASTRDTYVFDDYKSGDVIRISSVIDGVRQPPEAMGPVVNTGQWTAHPFIAPDESYLIWDSQREEGFGDSDLYISFRQPDSSWGPALNMGAHVNTDRWEAFATVTADGKYLLFNREVAPDNNDIFWVSATLIDKLREANASAP